MGSDLLQTKLFVPPIRPNLVPRPQLVEQLNQRLKSRQQTYATLCPSGIRENLAGFELAA